MPNRLIREGLMESERVLSVPVEARWLFVIICLSADDVGLFEATEFKLARRADINRDIAGKLMAMLADVDLIRLYEQGGKRYGFIPRFRQRVQIKNTKHPMPPRALYAHDADALSKINDLTLKTTVGAPVGSSWAGVGQPSEAEVEAEEKELSVASQPRRRRKAADVPKCPADDVVALYHAVLPSLPRVRLMTDSRRRALRKTWGWVLSSTKSDGSRRATTAEEALEWLRGYFVRASENDFLMGRTARQGEHAGWRCDLDFLLTERGMKHVIEKTQHEVQA